MWEAGAEMGDSPTPASRSPWYFHAESAHMTSAVASVSFNLSCTGMCVFSAV